MLEIVSIFRTSNNNKMTTTREIIEIINDLDHEVNRDTVRLIEREQLCENDFEVWIDGSQYRFINDEIIWETYLEEQEELIKECYLGMSNLPDWVAIDWEKTCKTLLKEDGYHHFFSRYDGKTHHEAPMGDYDWHIFRID